MSSMNSTPASMHTPLTCGDIHAGETVGGVAHEQAGLAHRAVAHDDRLDVLLHPRTHEESNNPIQCATVGGNMAERGFAKEHARRKWWHFSPP